MPPTIKLHVRKCTLLSSVKCCVLFLGVGVQGSFAPSMGNADVGMLDSEFTAFGEDCEELDDTMSVVQGIGLAGKRISTRHHASAPHLTLGTKHNLLSEPLIEEAQAFPLIAGVCVGLGVFLCLCLVAVVIACFCFAVREWSEQVCEPLIAEPGLHPPKGRPALRRTLSLLMFPPLEAVFFLRACCIRGPSMGVARTAVH